MATQGSVFPIAICDLLVYSSLMQVVQSANHGQGAHAHLMPLLLIVTLVGNAHWVCREIIHGPFLLWPFRILWRRWVVQDPGKSSARLSIIIVGPAFPTGDLSSCNTIRHIVSSDAAVRSDLSN